MRFVGFSSRLHFHSFVLLDQEGIWDQPKKRALGGVYGMLVSFTMPPPRAVILVFSS